MITGLERIAPGWGGVEGQPFTEGFFIFDVSDADQAETDRPFPNRQHGHASQFLRRRQSGSCRRRRAGFDRKDLSHRRYRRSGQSARSRPLLVAGAGKRRSDERLEIFLPRSGAYRRRSRLSFLRRRRRHHPRRCGHVAAKNDQPDRFSRHHRDARNPYLSAAAAPQNRLDQ